VYRGTGVLQLYSSNTLLQDWYRCKGVQEYYRGSADVQGYKRSGGIKKYSCSRRGEWMKK